MLSPHTVKSLAAAAVAELGSFWLTVHSVLHCATNAAGLVLGLEVLVILGQKIGRLLLPVRCAITLALCHFMGAENRSESEHSDQG